ncbi:MAG: amidohydrolase [Pseudomonadota bacterium]
MRSLMLASIALLTVGHAALAGQASYADDLREAVAEDYAAVEKHYKYFHANPELSYREEKSAKRIAKSLKSLGFSVQENIGAEWVRNKAIADAGEVLAGVGGYGIIAVFENGAGPTVLVRADMDGLPLEEKTGVAYASKVTSKDYLGNDAPVMHACGHDVHMSVFLGTARQLIAAKDTWSGTLVMVAQPAEETGTGALAMLDDGLFDRMPTPDYNLALHVSGAAPAGTIAYTPGYALAAVDSVDIIVKGVGGHGAVPHLAVDPILIGSRIVTTLQSIVAREVDPLEAGVITVGSFRAGYKHNIIPDEAHLKLTVRSYKEEVRERLLEGITRTARAQAASAGLPEDLYPEIKIEEDNLIATYNDPALTTKVVDVFKGRFGGERIIEAAPVMGGEDFAYFSQTDEKIPSFIFWLGGADPGDFARAKAGDGPTPPSIHSPFFAPVPEPTLKMGVEAMTAAALDLLDSTNE